MLSFSAFMKSLPVLILNIIFAGSVQLIIIPLIMPIYPSVFFVTLILSFESVIIFAMIMLGNDFYGLYMKKIWAFNYSHMYANIKLVIILGILQFLISVCFFYASHPIRTPILIQVILLGLGILPSVVLSKIILNNNKNYHIKYIIASVCFLLVSIFLGIVPLLPTLKANINSFIWCGVYALGIIFFSLSNVLQEKYISATDKKASTKFKLAFYTRLIQLVLTVGMFWIEPLLGYNNTFNDFFNNLWTDFISSIHLFLSSAFNFWMIQLYVFGRVISYILLIYLNQISANYSTIIGNINTQILALFFAIFPHLNKGFHYSVEVTMLNIFCNISSIIFWIKGEKVNENNSIELDDVNNIIENREEIPLVKKSNMFKIC